MKEVTDMPENSFNQPLLKLIDLNANDVFLGMVLAFILCAILSRMIRITTAGASSDKALPQTMIFIGAIVSLIMAVIGNSLARAFGAIGALSLIRFRTAVKSTNDLAYLFMAISIGMTCGSGYFAIATGATGLFSIFIIIVQKFTDNSMATRVSLLKISYSFNDEVHQKIMASLTKGSLSHRVLSEENSHGGKAAEMLVELTLSQSHQAASLVKDICEIAGDIKAAILID